MTADRNEALRLAEWLQSAVQTYPQMSEDEPGGYCTEVDQVMDQAAALLRQQAERIAELESRVHTCGPTCSKAGCINRRLTAERDQLRAEVERLRADAERYRWLRDNLESEWAICEWQDDPDGLGYYRDARAPEFVDAAIDHARTTHKDEG